MDEHHCQVWIAELGLLRPADDALLDDVELTRADTFVHPADRSRFVLGAALVKLALAGETGLAPAEVHVDRRCETCAVQHGRPRLDGSPIQLSVAHSGSLVTVALTVAGPVGIDVEHTSARRRTPPASRVLTASEPLRHPADLFIYWCRKESVVKATGEGLRVPLREVVVSPVDEPPRLLSYRGRSLVASMFDLDVGAEYTAALTVLTGDGITVTVDRADHLLGDESTSRSGFSQVASKTSARERRW